jgi:hypothetical protein
MSPAQHRGKLGPKHFPPAPRTTSINVIATSPILNRAVVAMR